MTDLTKEENDRIYEYEVTNGRYFFSVGKNNDNNGWSFTTIRKLAEENKDIRIRFESDEVCGLILPNNAIIVYNVRI